LSKHLTDYYLLALAVQQGASLATFDRRIDPALIKGGLEAYTVIQR
jgi:predicted nucleic acid-binding protein